VSYPSFADAGYLLFYPAAYVGIGLLLRHRTGRLPTGVWIDGLIGALAVAAVGGALAFGTVLSDTRGAPLTVATNLAYPLADLLLVGILVGIIVLSSIRASASWLALCVGMAVFAVTDSVYLIQTASNSYVNGGFVDVGWPLGLTIIALGAWQRPPRRAVRRLEGAPAFVLPTLAALSCLGLMFADHYHRLSVAAHLLAALCLLSVIARLGLTFVENQRMLRTSRQEAVTDALTGLGNRRSLEATLRERLIEAPVRPFVLAFYDLDGFKHYNDSFGHQAGDALLTRLGARLAQALPGALVFRLGGDEFCVVVDEADGGAASAALGAKSLTEHSTTFHVGCSYGLVAVPGEATDAEAAMLLADARMYERKHDRRPSAANESQGVLLRALAERNEDLGQHNDDVSVLVELVSYELGLDRAEVATVLRAAELHDVGKLAIPDAILNKPGPLTDEEWTFMRRHTIIGERIVASATSLSDVAPIVRATHERFDGRGYPDAMAGEDIPLGARVIAVCDAYDAMTTTRPYRQAMSEESALAELWRCAGGQFDPQVVAAFTRVRAGLDAFDTPRIGAGFHPAARGSAARDSGEELSPTA
jgi:diguanylate cyclase (GGDEF)-like protein